MNRNQIAFIVAPLLLIFGYQNCQKANLDAVRVEDSMISESSLNLKVVKLESERVESLQFKSREISQVVHGSNSISLVKILIYDFDIATGEFYIIDEDAQTNVRYCLNENLKNQIIQFLYASSVCKGGQTSSPEVMCTQAIQEGYANLITNREQFRLGYASDGCGNNAIDLCDGAEDLKSWFAHVRSQLPNLQCQ